MDLLRLCLLATNNNQTVSQNTVPTPLDPTTNCDKSFSILNKGRNLQCAMRKVKKSDHCMLPNDTTYISIHAEEKKMGVGGFWPLPHCLRPIWSGHVRSGQVSG